jgi:methyl halide transferase
MSNFLSADYWTKRYAVGQTGWDLGSPATPLKQYLDQIQNKSLRILIPGAGNAYEARYAFELGFHDVHVLDFSSVPLEHFKQNSPNFPDSQIHLQDFFSHQGSYDLILEQTFFCALNPSLRLKYVHQMKELLKPTGKLVGVLFNKIFENQGPPFGGTLQEYQMLFEREFDQVFIEPCHNSILPRQGSEVFIRISSSKG